MRMVNRSIHANNKWPADCPPTSCAGIKSTDVSFHWTGSILFCPQVNLVLGNQRLLTPCSWLTCTQRTTLGHLSASRRLCRWAYSQFRQLESSSMSKVLHLLWDALLITTCRFAQFKMYFPDVVSVDLPWLSTRKAAGSRTEWKQSTTCGSGVRQSMQLILQHRHLVNVV